MNTFKEKGYTAAHKEMDESMNRDLYEQIVRGIADGRKKNEADVRKLIDEGPFLPEDALSAGLVDEIAYEDQVDDKLRAGETRRHLDGDDYARVSLASVGLNKGPRIAVIYATGTINGGKSGYDPVNGAVVGSDTLIEYIRQARRDSSVRAIVLRVDSPGGSTSASDVIWRELVIAKTERADRPLIVSMSDLAASGGYYIAMPAQVIVAQPSTLTGSIGIFGGKFVTGGVYEKLGARIESTSIGRHAEINSPARPYNAEEVKKLRRAAAVVLRPVRREGRRVAAQHAGEDRRDRAGPRLDGTAGEAERAGRRARRAGSRGRGREAAREDRGRQRRRAGRLSAAQELLRAAVGADQRVRRVGAVGRGQRLAEREPLERGDRSAADHARPVRDVPPRRAAGAAAVHVRSLT